MSTTPKRRQTKNNNPSRIKAKKLKSKNVTNTVYARGKPINKPSNKSKCKAKSKKIPSGINARKQVPNKPCNKVVKKPQSKKATSVRNNKPVTSSEIKDVLTRRSHELSRELSNILNNIEEEDDEENGETYTGRKKAIQNSRNATHLAHRNVLGEDFVTQGMSCANKSAREYNRIPIARITSDLNNKEMFDRIDSVMYPTSLSLDIPYVSGHYSSCFPSP